MADLIIRGITDEVLTRMEKDAGDYGLSRNKTALEILEWFYSFQNTVTFKQVLMESVDRRTARLAENRTVKRGKHAKDNS